MKQTNASLLHDMLGHLRRHHPTMCRHWFEGIVPLGIDGGALNLRAQTPTHQTYLKTSCAQAFSEAAMAVTGHFLPVRFLGPNDPAPTSARVNERRAKVGVLVGAAATGSDGTDPGVPHAPEMVVHHGSVTGESTRRGAHEPPKSGRPAWTGDVVLVPDYTFENYIVGPENRFAHAAAKSVASQPGGNFNPLFIHGGVGLGKTHLLQAICLEILSKRPDASVAFLSCDNFMTQFYSCVEQGDYTALRHRFREVDVLVVDDIHDLKGKDRAQEEFFHTFNELKQSGSQIVLSSDAPPDEIPELSDRLMSRFKQGVVERMHPPVFETRVAIVKSKARVRGITIPDDVACLIAERCTTNVRELEGAISQMQIHSSVDARPIDMVLAREALGTAVPQVTPNVSIQSIFAAVTDFYGLKSSDLQSKKRERSVVFPRQIGMYLARRHTRLSLIEIGGYFGGRDHTTVLHANKSIESRLETDTGELRGVIAEIESKMARGDE